MKLPGRLKNFQNTGGRSWRKELNAAFVAQLGSVTPGKRSPSVPQLEVS